MMNQKVRKFTIIAGTYLATGISRHGNFMQWGWSASPSQMRMMSIENRASRIQILFLWVHLCSPCEIGEFVISQSKFVILRTIRGCSGKLSLANSPKYFLAALSYAFAAWISSLNKPRKIGRPLTHIVAAHFCGPFRNVIPLYLE